MNSILSLKKITKKYGDLKAIDDLCLTVEQGQIFGLLGPNGSGKTTLLGMLTGAVLPSSGSFTLFGVPPSSHLRRKLGVVLETPVFYPYLSGYRNLVINATIKKIHPKNITHVLALVDLTDQKEKAYQKYSLGMKQRLAIASAMLSDPDVLVLDEPTNGLDPIGIIEIRNLIIHIAQQGKTIIMASHILDEVEKVCSHFAVIYKGKLMFSGPTKESLSSDHIIEIESTTPQCKDLLNAFSDIVATHQEGHLYVVHLKKHVSPSTLNQYLVEEGVEVTHFKVRKKTLESQFMEILKNK